MSTSPDPDDAQKRPSAPRSDDPVVAELLSRCTFPPAGGSAPGARPVPVAVDCAVSGGPDSCALLALAIAAGLRVTAVHVDHGHRPESHRDGELVGSLAAAWGAAFRSERVDVADGGDLEARWRAARRAVLAPDTLFGHTADDQAETVLVRLIRGTGPAGLAAMDPGTHPLLGLRRRDTERLCAHLGVRPLRDPTNDDERFVRNRVRHEVLPLLDDVAGRDVVPLLGRLAAQAAAQRELLESAAAALDVTDARALAAAPRPLAAAALRRWWWDATASEHPPDEAATERMLAVACGEAVACDVVGGWRLERSSGRLSLVQAAAAGRRTRPSVAGSGGPAQAGE